MALEYLMKLGHREIGYIGSFKTLDDYKGKSEDKRLDLILVNKKIDVLKSNVIFNGENEEVISDHYGVEVII